jgi:hypothetical protein
LRGKVRCNPAILHTLDEDLKAFKLLVRPFYGGYQPARQLLTSGGGDGQEKPAAAYVLVALEMKSPASGWGAGGFYRIYCF